MLTAARADGEELPEVWRCCAGASAWHNPGEFDNPTLRTGTRSSLKQGIGGQEFVLEIADLVTYQQQGQCRDEEFHADHVAF